MITNRIDVEVTTEKEALVIQNTKDSRAQLDFLVGLSKKEIRRLAKLGSPYLEFTNRVRAHAAKFPGYMPQQVTVEMFNRDFKATESLHRILAEILSFEKDLENTILVLKSEIYQTSRLYYNAVQAAGRAGDKDAERIATDLSAHYKKKIPASTEPVEESGAANSANSQG